MKQVWITCPECDIRSLVTPEKTVRGQAKKRRPSQSVKAKDEIWRRAIKERDGYRCRRCGKTDDLQAAHLFTRGKHKTRWDVRAGFCLCGGCHIFWAHKEPHEFIEWAKQQLGEELFEELRQLSQTSVKSVRKVS